jgi:hypothetical protein
MFNIHVPNNWHIADGRLVLRLVDRKSRESKSIALIQGRPQKLLSSSLPNTAPGEVVVWIDLVSEHKATPLTSRVNLGSLKRLKSLRPLIYTKKMSLAQKTDLRSLIEVANAWRWIQPEDPRDVYSISHGIIHGLPQVDFSDNGAINMIMHEFEKTYNVNDGSEISNQIVYIWTLCKLNAIAKEIFGASGFFSRSESTDHVVERSSKAASELMLEFKKFTELPAPLAVAASLESVVLGRAHAENSYAAIMRSSNESIQKTGALAGVNSYGSLGKHAPIILPELVFLNIGGSLHSRSNMGRTTILYSANPAFLRSYLTRLVYYVALFPEYDYHMHIVGDYDECLELAGSVLEMFKLNQSIQGKSTDVSHISFSVSQVPSNVPKKTSYYASARYFFARDIMAVTGSPVWIQDVDLFPTGDTLRYLKDLNKHDVSLFFSHYLHGTFPWIRYLAGNVYVNNTENGVRFLDAASAYLAEWVTVKESWTVDQNALAFAVESCGIDLDIADVRRMGIPLQQSSLASRIEN